MTPSTLAIYEKGKTYTMKVVFVKSRDRTIIVYDNGTWHGVEVEGNLTCDIKALNDSLVDFICTEITSTGPQFILAPRYFAAENAAPPPVLGTKLELERSNNVEFKQSILFSPETNQLNSDQPWNIAKEIAALMNTDGGDLYLGVDNNGFVMGCDGDFDSLGRVPIMANEQTDASWTYPATQEGYRRKLQNLICFYLGETQSRLVDEPEFITDELSGFTYVKLHINPTAENITYIGREDEIFYRTGTSVIALKGRERDEYTKERFHCRNERMLSDVLAMFKRQTEEAERARKEAEERLAEALSHPVAPISPLPGTFIQVGKKYIIDSNTTYPLEAGYLEPIAKPAGLVYMLNNTKLQRTIIVKEWNDFYEALLRLLSSLDPRKFDSLPDASEFYPDCCGGTTEPNFVRRGQDGCDALPAEDYTDFEFGTMKNIRAKRTGFTDKSVFTDETLLPRRLLNYFGIHPDYIRVYVELS